MALSSWTDVVLRRVTVMPQGDARTRARLVTREESPGRRTTETCRLVGAYVPPGVPPNRCKPIEATSPRYL